VSSDVGFWVCIGTKGEGVVLVGGCGMGGGGGGGIGVGIATAEMLESCVLVEFIKQVSLSCGLWGVERGGGWQNF